LRGRRRQAGVTGGRCRPLVAGHLRDRIGSASAAFPQAASLALLRHRAVPEWLDGGRSGGARLPAGSGREELDACGLEPRSLACGPRLGFWVVGYLPP
jgi:hypothetical protein